MNWRFQWLYRGAGAALVMLLCWSLWASAQSEAPAPGTNAPTSATNPPVLVPGKLLLGLGHLDQHHLSFGLDGVPFLRDNTAFGQPLWKYLASVLFILLAFYVSKFLDYAVNRWLRRLTDRTETKYDDLALELLRGPVKVITFVILLHVGLTVFDWPLGAQVWLSRMLILVVAISLTYLAVKLVDMLVGVWLERMAGDMDKSFHQQLIPTVRKSIKAFVILVAILLTASNLGINITGLLASLSIGGLALGLAAQDTLANLFGAVAVYLDKPFHIGDRIRIESVDGTVENIGLRSTRVRSLDGHLVAIPNKTVGNAIITNVSRRPNIKTEMNFGLTYDTPAAQVTRATQILAEVYRAHPRTADLVISFNRFADSALNILVVHWWDGTDYKAYMADLQALNLQILERFGAAGINFAFPSQTVYLRPEAEPPAAPKP